MKSNSSGIEEQLVGIETKTPKRVKTDFPLSPGRAHPILEPSKGARSWICQSSPEEENENPDRDSLLAIVCNVPLRRKSEEENPLPWNRLS